MDTNPERIREALAQGSRRALAKAITLVESTRPEDRAPAEALLRGLAPNPDSLRIGLSGTPGVGKSTFTERFGLMLCAAGARVAVLAVDPSSARSGGSILGDKTRMDRLARHPDAFIRPTPSATHLGGVARRTREVVALVEAAGFDTVIVETVGVGQSETLVADMTDVFVLLLAPGGGDELQGVKRGIMEIADLIVINKADGAMKAQAARTAAEYSGALRLMRRRDTDPEGVPKAMTVSALEGEGVAAVKAEIDALIAWRRAHGIFARTRARQTLGWFRQEIELGLMARLGAHPATAALRAELEAALLAGTLTPQAAARQLLDAVFAGAPARPATGDARNVGP